ncbi:unnamed protein product [Peniophora sp. CBMAI 1063]|nr:unnamed protein product [Peniophora sp. CBMAI 1063]
MPRIDFLSDLLRPRRRAVQETRETKPFTLRSKKSIVNLISSYPEIVFPRDKPNAEESCCPRPTRTTRNRKRPPPLRWKLYEAPSLYSMGDPSEETLVPASPGLSRSPSSSTSHGNSSPSTPSPSTTSHSFHSPPPSPLRLTVSSYFRRETDPPFGKTLPHDDGENLDNSLVTLEAGLVSLRRRRSLLGLGFERNSFGASRPVSLASSAESRSVSASLDASRLSSMHGSGEVAVESDPFARDGSSFLEPRKPVPGDVDDVSAYMGSSQDLKRPEYEHWARDMRSRADTDHRPTLPMEKDAPSAPSLPSAQRKGTQGRVHARTRARTVSAPSAPRRALVRNAKSLPPIPDDTSEYEPGGTAEASDSAASGQRSPVGTQVERRVHVQGALSRQIDELMALIDAY